SQLLARFVGLDLTPLHVGHVEQEAGYIILAARSADPALADDPGTVCTQEFRGLLKLDGFAGRKHLAFGGRKLRRLCSGEEIAVAFADHGFRRETEHGGES